MRILHGDSLHLLPTLAADSVDSVVTDPPYALNFMGKSWDTGEVAFSEEFWAEVLRVLKPGGHVAAFGASRGYHRMACAIEDAGFEIRDSLLDIVRQDDDVSVFLDSLNDAQREAFARTFESSQFGGALAWIYGTGFPKGLDVSKQIDKALGAERKVIGKDRNFGKSRLEDGKNALGDYAGEWDITAPSSPEAIKFAGFSTALKPAFEPIVLARKPLSEGTVAANVLRWGTGALNIDGCRVGTDEKLQGGGSPIMRFNGQNDRDCWGEGYERKPTQGNAAGRWPANVVHDGSDEVVGAFPDSKGGGKPHVRDPNGSMGYHGGAKGLPGVVSGHAADGGSAARFFYSAKASKADRAGSKHPTVKPIALMQWLARLITPPGGTVLDPFAGSGTTGAACEREGFDCILIERETEYVADIKRRLGEPVATPSMEDMLA